MTAPTASGAPGLELRAEDLVPHADGALLATLCGCGVATELRRAIAGSGRVRARLAYRMREAFGAPGTATLPDSLAARILASGPPAAFGRLVLLAGALSAAGPIRRTVDRTGVARLRSALGPDLYAAVLAEGGVPAPGGTVPADGAAVRAAGLACLADWLAPLGPGAAALVAVRLPGEEAGALAPAVATPGGAVHVDVAAETLGAEVPAHA